MSTRKYKSRKCKFRKCKSRKCKSRKYKSRKYKSRKRGGQPDKEVWRITRAIEPLLNYFPRKFKTRRINKNNQQVVYEYMKIYPNWYKNSKFVQMLKDEAGENVFEGANEQFQAEIQSADTLQSLQDKSLLYSEEIMKNFKKTPAEAEAAEAAAAELQKRVNNYLKLQNPEKRNKILKQLEYRKEEEEEEEEKKLF